MRPSRPIEPTTVSQPSDVDGDEWIDEFAGVEPTYRLESEPPAWEMPDDPIEPTPPAPRQLAPRPYLGDPGTVPAAAPGCPCKQKNAEGTIPTSALQVYLEGPGVTWKAYQV